MKILLIISNILVLLFCGEIISTHEKSSAGSFQKSEELSFYDIDALKEVRNKLAGENSDYNESYAHLIKLAKLALNEGPFSVTTKTTTPPSGDKRDYFSLGPYWWPDPKNDDGLPWVRKDGRINPKTRGEHVDVGVKNQFFGNVEILTWAYFFSEESIYKDKLIELLDVWLLDEKTRMNPSLNYAQGIPGICSGRGIGIIEFTAILKLLNAIEILEVESGVSREKASLYRDWCSAFRTWLYESEYGNDEKRKKNNHGTWYDVEYIGLSIFLNKDDEALKHLQDFSKERIGKQISNSGAQVHELERSKSMSYSTMNLRAFLKLSAFAGRYGIDLFNYENKNGSSIKKAALFLLPYAKGVLTWPYQQISDIEKAKANLLEVLHIANDRYEFAKELPRRNSSLKLHWNYLLQDS